MTMVDPATGWFEITEVPSYSIEDNVKKDEIQNIDTSSARISQLFEQAWLGRYPRPKQVIFDHGPEFKMHFVPLLKDFK